MSANNNTQRLKADSEHISVNFFLIFLYEGTQTQMLKQIHSKTYMSLNTFIEKFTLYFFYYVTYSKSDIMVSYISWYHNDSDQCCAFSVI